MHLRDLTFWDEYWNSCALQVYLITLLHCWVERIFWLDNGFLFILFVFILKVKLMMFSLSHSYSNHWTNQKTTQQFWCMELGSVMPFCVHQFISKYWSIHTAFVFVFVLSLFFRGFAQDALGWNLWIRCALLGEGSHRGFCGHKAYGVGTWSIWTGGEGWLRSQTS